MVFANRLNNDFLSPQLVPSLQEKFGLAILEALVNFPLDEETQSVYFFFLECVNALISCCIQNKDQCGKLFYNNYKHLFFILKPLLFLHSFRLLLRLQLGLSLQ